MKLTRENIAIIEGDEYLSRDIELAGRLDVAREYLLQFRQYIPEGGVVIDVGACLGDYTATFAEFVGPTGAVFAFEPNPAVAACLRHNMKRFSNVAIAERAFGSLKQLTARMVIDTHNVGASYLQDAGIKGDVHMWVLDAFCEQMSRLDFIKIDTEGYEPWILDGGVNTINRFRPAILIEIDQRALGLQGSKPSDVHARLDALNYNFERFDGAHGNILCLPK